MLGTQKEKARSATLRALSSRQGKSRKAVQTFLEKPVWSSAQTVTGPLSPAAVPLSDLIIETPHQIPYRSKTGFP
jgi:hypothetical protein